MFDYIISNLLNTYLGAFLETVDTAQLRASILSGNIQLENMRLKSSLFNDSPLPFRLEYGQVGKISIKIPYWDMFQSPLVIEIEDVFGLVKLNPVNDWNVEKQKEIYQAYVLSLL